MPYNINAGLIAGQQATQNTLDAIAQRKVLLAENDRKQAEFDYEQEQRDIEAKAFADLASGAKGSGVSSDGSAIVDGSDPASMLITAGTRMLSAGAPKRGQDLIKAGVEYLDKLQNVEEGKATAQKNRIESTIKVADFVHNSIGKSQNEDEWQANLAMLESRPELLEVFGRENFEAMKQLQFSPELAQYFGEQALSYKDQAELDLKQLQADRQIAADADLQLYRASLLRINQGNLDARMAELANKGKAEGDKIPKAATGDQFKQSKTSIIAQVFNGQSPEAGTPEDEFLNFAADDIATQALQLQRDTPGLEYGDALNRVVAQAQQNGDFAPVMVRNFRDFGLFETKGEVVDSGKRRYAPKGRTPDKAITLPRGSVEDVRKQLIKGRYYKLPNGSTLKWNGSEFDE